MFVITQPVFCDRTAADLWSLNQARVGDSDSVHQSSSLTSVGVFSHAHADTTDSLVRDVKRGLHNGASVVRPQRLNNISLDCRPDGADENDDDDACYRTLADSMTAGAYQIKLDDRVTVISR